MVEDADRSPHRLRFVGGGQDNCHLIQAALFLPPARRGMPVTKDGETVRLDVNRMRIKRDACQMKPEQHFSIEPGVTGAAETASIWIGGFVERKLAIST